MANLIRSARSGSDWTTHDLTAYRVEIVNVLAADFFGAEPDVIHPRLAGFGDWVIGQEPTYLPDSSRRLAYYLHRILTVDRNQESCVDNFLVHLLDELLMAQGSIVPRSPNNLPLQISGVSSKAQADMTLVNYYTVLMLGEDKTLLSPRDPEAQLVAEAIAGFQTNNTARLEAGLPVLDVMAFPCLTMVGTRPTFYQIEVTTALSQAVKMAQYPPMVTYVRKCDVVVPARDDEDVGMHLPQFRIAALRYFTSFKNLAENMWSVFRVG